MIFEKYTPPYQTQIPEAKIVHKIIKVKYQNICQIHEYQNQNEIEKSI